MLMHDKNLWLSLMISSIAHTRTIHSQTSWQYAAGVCCVSCALIVVNYLLLPRWAQEMNAEGSIELMSWLCMACHVSRATATPQPDFSFRYRYRYSTTVINRFVVCIVMRQYSHKIHWHPVMTRYVCFTSCCTSAREWTTLNGTSVYVRYQPQ